MLFATKSILQMFREDSAAWHVAGYVSCGIVALVGIAAISFTVFSSRYFRDAAPAAWRRAAQPFFPGANDDVTF